MSKNYAQIYESTNDSSAQEQRFYIKEESIRGTFAAPTDADFFFVRQGGSLNTSQAREASEHRSGRHNQSTIDSKKETSWSWPTYWNILSSAANGNASVDPAIKLLWKSLLGREQILSDVPTYDSANAPNTTFTIIEAGDFWSKQTVGGFVNELTANFPGDGQSGGEWSGNAKEALFVGIGKSTVDNTGGNTVTMETDDGFAIPVGAQIAFTRDGLRLEGTDTTPRKVIDRTGDVITVDGAAFTDLDGSTDPVYVHYYEPENPTAINEPAVGLQGEITVDGVTSACIRNATVTFNNNHELVDYCFGTDSLAAPFYVPGGRLTVNVEIELNMNANIVRFYNEVVAKVAKAVTIKNGDVNGRFLQLELPKVEFAQPEVSVPDSGSIPTTFSGLALQTATAAADEVTATYQ